MIFYQWKLTTFLLVGKPAFPPQKKSFNFRTKNMNFLKKNYIINGDFVIYFVFHILQGYFIIWNTIRWSESREGNFYRLFDNINYLENPIVICIKKSGKFAPKKWSESREGNFYRIFHSTNYLENPIVIYA